MPVAIDSPEPLERTKLDPRIAAGFEFLREFFGGPYYSTEEVARVLGVRATYIARKEQSACAKIAHRLAEIRDEVGRV